MVSGHFNLAQGASLILGSDGKTRHSSAPVGKLFQTLRHVLIGYPPDSDGTAPALKVRLRCGKCGEVIATRIDKASDLECEFPDDDGTSLTALHPTGYVLHKEVVGRRCQNLIHFTMRFDDHRRVMRYEIEGGELLGWEDTQ